MRQRNGILATVIVAIVALSGVSAVQAASQFTPAERDYVTVRDAAIARIKARVEAADKIDDAISAEDKNALAELATRLRAIVGAVTMAGFGSPKSNIETLIPEMGFGQLDGLVAASADGKSSVIVTTVPLLMDWLRGHKNWWGKKHAAMPQDIAAALRTEGFYTQATASDAAMVQYGALPVKKPAGATLAFAIFAARTQDMSPPAPDQVFVTLVKGGKVFIGHAPLAQAIVPDPSCAALRATFHQRAEKAFEAYRAGGLKDARLADRASAREKEGDEKQRRCVGEKLAAGARAQAAKQAQAMIEAMAQ